MMLPRPTKLVAAPARWPPAILDSRKSTHYNTPLSPARATGRAASAQVAQLVEHCTENAGVGGSIPPLGTYP
jgi:hypothetical protein